MQAGLPEKVGRGGGVGEEEGPYPLGLPGLGLLGGLGLVRGTVARKSELIPVQY